MRKALLRLCFEDSGAAGRIDKKCARGASAKPDSADRQHKRWGLSARPVPESAGRHAEYSLQAVFPVQKRPAAVYEKQPHGFSSHLPAGRQ